MSDFQQQGKASKYGYITLAMLAIALVVLIIKISPINQDQNYHQFSDQSAFLNIPNFGNVISNVPFIVIGIFGLTKVSKQHVSGRQYSIFFVGIALVSIGSGYYHWEPNNETLVWDRLPMTLGFMGLFAAVIGEFINKKAGVFLLVPMVVLGLISVWIWVRTDNLGLYSLVQFYPMLAIPAILIFFPSSTASTKGMWTMLVLYGIAKVMELFDPQIHEFLSVLSGHTLKHLFADLGIFLFIQLHFKNGEAQ